MKSPREAGQFNNEKPALQRAFSLRDRLTQWTA
jgi:hypothetical protein